MAFLVAYLDVFNTETELIDCLLFHPIDLL
jgi:hypothetical protein